MRRREIRENDALSGVEGSASYRTPKRRLLSLNNDMNREIEDLEEEEISRREYKQRQKTRELKRLELDSQRTDFEKSIHESNKLF